MNRARWLAAVVLVVAIGVTAGVIATADSGPNRVQAALERAIDPHSDPCASVTLTDLGPSGFPRTLAQFARLAAQRSDIVCNFVGPTTVYFRFPNRHDLQAALLRDPDARDLCILEHEAFTGNNMNFAAPPGRHPFQDTCAALHGLVLL